MPRFPKKEAEIVAFASQLAYGMLTNMIIFSNPPVHPFLIFQKKAIYQTCRGDFVAAHAAAESAVADKDEKLSVLTEAMKADIRYAENTVNFDDDKLKLIGWAGRKAKTSLTPPGQVRMLEAPKQGAGGAGWVFLDWKQPAAGGKPKAYKVQRRSGENWADVATAILSEITLVDQPEKTQIEYRVIAINKSGEGPESNVVEVVL